MKKIFLLVSLAMVSLTPLSSSAFVFTDAQVLKLNDTTALFSLSYSIRFLEQIAYHPMYINTTNDETNRNATQVEIFGATKPVSVTGFVESNAEVVSKKYRVPMNSKEVQTVHVLVTADADQLDAISVGLKKIPINAVTPGEQSKFFSIGGAVVEQSRTETVADSI